MSDTSVVYNPFEPGFAEDPYPRYRAMREGDPVHHNPLGFWMLFGYDDVLRFLRDPGLSVEDRNARLPVRNELVRQLVGERADRGNKAMLNRDAPDHTRLRRLVQKAFTPRVIELLKPRIAELVDELLDRASGQGQGRGDGRGQRGGHGGQGEADLIPDFAFPLPFAVISEMMGIEPADGEQLRAWSSLLVRTLEPLADPTLIVAIGEAADAMREFLQAAIARKHAHPVDDLLSALISAEEQGDVLSDEELLEQVMLLYIAGHETTVNLIGNGMLALMRFPEQWERLRASCDDPTFVANAVEELLRFDSPVQMSRRITLHDTSVGGVEIKAGSFVALGLASANRDKSHWGETVDELDLGRPGANQHLSFGGGVHYCLGAALARLEAAVALTALVRRFPDLALAGQPQWNGRLNLRGLDHLPVRLGS